MIYYLRYSVYHGFSAVPDGLLKEVFEGLKKMPVAKSAIFLYQ